MHLAPLPYAPGELATHPTLSPDELARAQRYHHPLDGTRFAAGRTALRKVLAAHLGLAAEAVRFGAGLLGKPCLLGDGDLRFSFSRSGEYALIAVAVGCELGVDLQQWPPANGLRALAERVCTPAELEGLRTTPEADLPAAFARLWAAKEAFVKACGAGLALPLAQVGVHLPVVGSAALVDPASGDPLPGWRLHTLPAPTGYAAALCTEAMAGTSPAITWAEPTAN